MQRSKAPKSKLKQLFDRQQPKVNASQRKAELLRTFAEDDYKRIARLIQRWLEESEKKAS